MTASSTFLLNHLLQSTVFAIAAASLAFALRNNRAEVRFRIWLAASVKFLIPFSWIVSVGGAMKLPASAVPATPVLRAAEQLERSVTLSLNPLPAVHTGLPLSSILLALWAMGALLVLFHWAAAWVRLHRLVASSLRIEAALPIPVHASSEPIEPGVFGIVRPVMLLPEALLASLGTVEMDAILAHELCHVRRRDNLIAALHSGVQALFWFHPGVWFIGSRLLEERELACDEEVIGEGKDRESYAEGILRVCRLCLEPTATCAAGVTGSNLRKRIEGILSGRVSARLGRVRIAAITTAITFAVVGPVGLGILKSRAQESAATRPHFEIATIKTTDPNERGMRYAIRPPGNLSVLNMTLKNLISSAYDVHQFQVVGGPHWIDTDRFDIEAKPGDALAPISVSSSTEAQRREFAEQFALRVQSLLADRFHLVIRRETKEMPVYELTIAKGGSKLKQVEEKPGQGGQIRGQRGVLTGTATSIGSIASNLALRVERPVIDKTGLQGKYDWQFEWTPEQPAKLIPGSDRPLPSEISGPSIFMAVQEQLGLRLEPQRAPAPVIIVESASKPSAN